MKPLDIVAYLWGSEAAIARIAASPNAIWVGVLLVMTAGIARTYARKDLRREPWHLAVPLVASWVTCTVFFGILVAVARWLSVPTGPLPTIYRSLLSVYWMTAPLAWAYAIPYERWQAEDEAVASRLRTLAVVAVWRVALMVRVLTVMFDSPVRPALVLVLLFGAMVTVVAMVLVRWGAKQQARQRPTLLMDGMAAIHIGPPRLTLEEEEDQVTVASGCVFALAVVSLPVLFILLCVGLPRYGRWDWSRWAAPELQVAPVTWWLAGGAIVVWLLVLPFSQRKLRRASDIDARRRELSVAELLGELGRFKRSAFPAHWRPPPSSDFATSPKILDVMDHLDQGEHPRWLHEEYTRQFREYLELAAWYWPYDDALRRIADLLESREDGRQLASISAEALEMFQRSLDFAAEGEKVSEELQREFSKLREDVIEIPLPPSSPLRRELIRRIRTRAGLEET